ncbi:YtxH domain-containing protein [Gordonia asplenii]
MGSARESTGRDGVLDTRRGVTRCSVGATVPSVALAAHGLAGGGFPTSGMVLVAGIGAIAAMLTRGAGLARVFGVLSVAQAASHLALMLAHGDMWTLDPASMLMTHLVAIPVSALAIMVVAQLISLITSVLRVVVGPVTEPAAGAPPWHSVPAVLVGIAVVSGRIRGPPSVCADASDLVWPALFPEFCS